MHVRPHDGPVEDGLSSCLLRFVQSDGQIEQLREELSGFSHRCRNLLNGMKISLYLVQKTAEQPLPSSWTDVDENYRGIEQLFDQLQSIYRPLALTPIRATLGSLVQDRRRTWDDWFDSVDIPLLIGPPSHESVGEFDPMCLTLGLDAFVRWRAWAMPSDRQARLTWRTGDGQFHVRWEEKSRPEVPNSKASSSGAAAADCAGTAVRSLGLPLLARVMTAHHGSMEWSREPDFSVTLRWPLCQSNG